MSHEYTDFERAAAKRIAEFLDPSLKRKPAPPACPSQRETFVVRLAVRMKRLSIDDLFEFRSERQSRLEAQIEAEQAARAAGWPIIGHVHSVERL